LESENVESKELKKGRPRRLEEDSLHAYWNRKAKGRKRKGDVDRLVEGTFGIKVNTPKRSCLMAKGEPALNDIVVPNNEEQHNNTKEKQATPPPVPSDTHEDGERIVN